jgi:DNA-binding transcriptional ArsR family regulator
LVLVDVNLAGPRRWELYRLLAEPVRLRLLALAAEEELGIGELADLLEENQPNISRHAAALRQAGLLQDRREGTRTLVRTAAGASRDPVVADALVSGRALCERDGSLSRIPDTLRAREAPTREFFGRPSKVRLDAMPSETGAYLCALACLLPRRSMAVDAGTGDGRLLDVLAPVYERVIAVDRSKAQLERARERIAMRGFANVELIDAEIDSPQVLRALGLIAGRSGSDLGADAVFASRVLHHAPQPAQRLGQLASLCAPGGSVVVIEYAAHDDESMREQADAWLGFAPAALRRFARAAGLEGAVVARIPSVLCGDGPDRHLPWQVLVANKPNHPDGKGPTNGS